MGQGQPLEAEGVKKGPRIAVILKICPFSTFSTILLLALDRLRDPLPVRPGAVFGTTNAVKSGFVVPVSECLTRALASTTKWSAVSALVTHNFLPVKEKDPSSSGTA